MANQGDAFTQELERSAQELGGLDTSSDVPSPSQALLQRLKNMREWQKKQREELHRAQLCSFSSPSLSCLEENLLTPQFIESQGSENTPLQCPAMLHAREEDYEGKDLPVTEIAAPEVPMNSQVLERSPERYQAKIKALLKEGKDKQQLSPHEEHDLGKEAPQPVDEIMPVSVFSQINVANECQVLVPASVQAPVLFDTLDSHRKVLKEPNEANLHNPRDRVSNPPYSFNTQEDLLHSEGPSITLPSHMDSSNLIDNSAAEEVFGDETREPYQSEKYRSTAIPERDIIDSSQVKKKMVTNKPQFTLLARSLQSGTGEALEKDERSKRRYLKKGEGTARFGMRPVRLKKAGTGDERVRDLSHNHQEVRQGGSEALQARSTSASVPVRSQFRLPMQTLQLKSVPQKTAVGPPDKKHSIMLPTQGSSQPARELSNPPPPPPPPPPTAAIDSEKQRQREEEELFAFERLEELAADSSFSSSSSTVWQLLRQGQQSVSSTPLRTPPPFALQETPVVGPLNSNGAVAKPHPLKVDLINKVMQAQGNLAPGNHQELLSISQGLEQLKAIVTLEGHSTCEITESDIHSLLESYSGQHLSVTLNPTAPVQTPLSQPHRVHFASEGVRVLEYELSDAEGEDTLTDATSIVEEDSDLVTTSDLETLLRQDIKDVSSWRHRQRRPSEQGVSAKGGMKSMYSNSSSETTHRESTEAQGSRPVALQFSPPPLRPQQSASNYIWSIFGKERDDRKCQASKECKNSAKQLHIPHESKRESVAVALEHQHQHQHTGGTTSEEVEAHKILLLAKVAELEKEMKLFKRNNLKLQELRQLAEEEKQALAEERCKLQEEAAIEKKRFQEYVNRERNVLWREKQQIIQPAQTTTELQGPYLEVVQLQEQLYNLKEECNRKESMSQFSIKKLTEKNKVLEEEVKRLKIKNTAVQNLEKENQDLRLKVNHTMARLRSRPTPCQPAQPARGRPKSGGRPTPKTIDGINRALESMARPQPVVLREAQIALVQPKLDLESNEDILNNNPSVAGKDGNHSHTSLQVTENTGAEQRVSPTTQSATCPEDSTHLKPHHELSQVAVPNTTAGSPRYTEGLFGLLSRDVGLEHTERLLENGTKELIYANGNRKEIHPSGLVTITYYNGDRKEIHADKTVYVYGTDQTSHTTFNDGREELVFPGGQRETRFPDGSSEIIFTDGSVKIVNIDGSEVCTMKDGSVVRSCPDGSRVFEFPSGQREVHQAGEKRREYPDGTIKILHDDGTTETRYKSGRRRIRDQQGNLVLDTY